MTIFSLEDFFGDEEKKPRIPLQFVGAWTIGGGRGIGVGAGGEGASALNWAIICGSRRTLRVKVNSNLLCSMLEKRR